MNSIDNSHLMNSIDWMAAGGDSVIFREPLHGFYLFNFTLVPCVNGNSSSKAQLFALARSNVIHEIR